MRIKFLTNWFYLLVPCIEKFFAEIQFNHIIKALNIVTKRNKTRKKWSIQLEEVPNLKYIIIANGSNFGFARIPQYVATTVC